MWHLAEIKRRNAPTKPTTVTIPLEEYERLKAYEAETQAAKAAEKTPDGPGEA